MAYGYTEITGLTNNFQQWNVSNVSGTWWNTDYITGGTSGATAYVVSFVLGFSYQITGLAIISDTSTTFSSGETVTSAGGGSAVLSGSIVSQKTDSLVIVSGTDTADVFEYLYGLGLGYEGTNGPSMTYSAYIMLGDPQQTAVSTIVAQNSSIELKGLYGAGNATYRTSVVFGSGTKGDRYSSRQGCSITPTAIDVWGSTCSGRYVDWEMYGCFHEHLYGRCCWDVWCQECTFGDGELYQIGNSFIALGGQMDRDGTEEFGLLDCRSNNAILLGHVYPNFDGVIFGGGNYGVVVFGNLSTTVFKGLEIEDYAINSVYFFASGGTPTFLDFLFDETDIDGFFQNITVSCQRSVDLLVTDPDGNPLQGARVRCWWDEQAYSATPQFDVTTAADGTITTQTPEYYEINSPGTPVDHNPLKFLITLKGFVEDNFGLEMLSADLADGQVNFKLVRALKLVDMGSLTE